MWYHRKVQRENTFAVHASNCNVSNDTTNVKPSSYIKSSNIVKGKANVITRRSIDEDYHCATPMTRRGADELIAHDHKFYSQTLGECRGRFARFQQATKFLSDSATVLCTGNEIICDHASTVISGDVADGRGGARISILI